MTNSPKQNPPKSGEGGQTLAVIGGAIILIFLIGKCSSQGQQLAAPENMIDANMSTAIAEQAPPKPEPLNERSLSKGTAELPVVLKAAAYSGVMIYSQNCYDALGRSFSWPRLDICGAFDALASRAVLQDSSDIAAAEESYFQSEASAGRYLAAATGGGETPEHADARLSALQSRIDKVAVTKVTEKGEAEALENDTTTLVEEEPLDNVLADATGWDE